MSRCGRSLNCSWSSLRATAIRWVCCVDGWRARAGLTTVTPDQMARASWGVVNEAARSRNPRYIAWSAHRSRSALVLLTAPNAENDQCRDQQQRPRLRLLAASLTTGLVAVSDYFDYDFLTAIDDSSSESGFRWIPFHVDGGRGWLGPAIVPGETPNYRDVLARRLCAAGSLSIFHALTNPPVYGQPHTPPDTELLWMLSILSIEVKRWVAGVTPASSWNEVELDPVNFAVTLHPVLPLPERDGLRAPRRFGMEVFVDERTGIVNRLERVKTHCSVPNMLHIVQSVACDMRRISFWSNGRLNHGSSFFTYEAAKNSAIAECIERYCGNRVDSKKLVQASYNELASRGDHAVDPERLVLHSTMQYEAAGFPLVPFTRDLRVYWVRGQCLSCDRAAWIPASLVHVNWYLGPYADDPPTSYAIFSGIAAGSSWDAAVAAGLEEIIERDATMIWWLNAHRLPGVQLTADLEAVWAGPPTKLGQRAWLIYLENEFAVPVMAGIVENVQDELLTIGFAVRPDPAEAGLKAWAEALGLQETARLMRDPASSFWRITANLISDQSLKAPREDRQYLNVYRNDFRDVNTLLSQLQVNLDPRAREILRGWIDVAPVRPVSSLPRLPDRTSATYRALLEQRGFEVFAVDMTTPDVAMTNIKVARVVVPGLVPNYPAAFPPFGRRRIQDMAVALGWRDRPLDEQDLNIFPMPHA